MSLLSLSSVTRASATRLVSIKSRFYAGSLPSEPPELLRNSLNEYGILVPLWVIGDGPWEIVSGFRRYQAACAVGLEFLPVHVLEGVDPAALLRKTASENAATRGLSLQEKTGILRALRLFGASEDALVRADLPRLGLAPVSKILRTFHRLEHLSEPLLTYLSEKDCPVRRLTSFLELDPAAERFVAALINRFRPGLNDLEAASRCLVEIARRDGAATGDVARKIQLPPEGSGDSAASFARVLEELLAVRYPELSAIRRRATSRAQKIRLPPQARLRWDNTFENLGVSLEAPLRRDADVNRLLQDLSDPGNRGALKDLLDELP